MLENKNYCDYETCVALKELGYSPVNNECFQSKIVSKEIPLKFFDTILQGTSLEYAPIISLYEAQKFLRNTHNLHISTKPYPCEDGLMWMYEIRRFTPYLVCVIKNKTGFRKEEEAFSKGITEAVKILKEDDNKD